MKTKTQDLSGIKLDWAVAKCEGTLAKKPSRCFDCKYHEERAGRDEAIYNCWHPKSVHDTDGGWGTAIAPEYGVHPRCPITELTPEPYSVDWAQAGPIIDRLMRDGLKLSGYVSLPSDPTSCQAQINAIVTGGPTPLIAAMRCFCLAKLGDVVDIPEDLI